jgi:hypothetical protein
MYAKMEYEFFVSKRNLPDGFRYPNTYIAFVNSELINIEPWHFYYKDGIDFAFNGLKERYPSRSIVPFARRRDNDDVACFEAGEISNNPRVIIIHDWASEGWENRGEYKDFIAWVELAKKESKEWQRL